MIHDVCMQHLPVTFLIDRAGLVGEDSSTHHGIFDFASMLPVPGFAVLAPRDIQELRAMVRWSAGYNQPCAILYGRQSVDMTATYPFEHFTFGQWEVMEKGRDGCLLAVGSMVEYALAVRNLLIRQGISLMVVNCATVKPLDESFLRENAHMPMITLEEHLLTGGFGASVASFCIQEELPQPILSIGIPDMYVKHGNRSELLKYLGLQPKALAGRVLAVLRGQKDMRRGG